MATPEETNGWERTGIHTSGSDDGTRTVGYLKLMDPANPGRLRARVDLKTSCSEDPDRKVYADIYDAETTTRERVWGVAEILEALKRRELPRIGDLDLHAADVRAHAECNGGGTSA
jgi:hypothetical protein